MWSMKTLLGRRVLEEFWCKVIGTKTNIDKVGRKGIWQNLDQFGSIIERFTISICLVHCGYKYVCYLYSRLTFSIEN